jgi:hypothetical protein
LRQYENVKVYSEVTEVKLDKLKVLFIPWINQENEENTFKVVQNTSCKCAMGHLELNGFEMFKGVVSDHGADKSLFDRFHMVFSGHYHHKSSTDNIHYLGAFTEHTWSDFNDPRGFHIFDTETRQLEFFQNPHVMFKMLAYDDVKHKDIMEKIAATDYSKYANSYVKIVCVNRENPYAFDVLMDKLYKAGPVDISVVEDLTTLVDNNPDGNVDQTQDTVTIITKYIEDLTLPVNNAKMIDYMKDVYMEALAIEHVE